MPERNGNPRVCGAKTRSGGECQQIAMENLRCKMHGGLTPKGVASPQFRHGRYSKYLGKRWAKAYEESLADTDGLLDLTETLAILDTNVKRAAKRVDERDTPDFRRRALTLFEQAHDASTPEETAAKLRDLGTLLRSGVSKDRSFRRLTDAAEKLAKRSEAAWKVRLGAATAINAADLTGVLVRVISILREEIHDRTARELAVRRISHEVMARRVGPRAHDC